MSTSKSFTRTSTRTVVLPQGLTYDDVLLVPQRSSLASRADADLSTHLTRNIKLSIPLVSANMDTVTKGAMALSLAKLGGIGIIHRFLPIEKEADEVAVVKRAGKFLGRKRWVWA